MFAGRWRRAADAPEDCPERLWISAGSSDLTAVPIPPDLRAAWRFSRINRRPQRYPDDPGCVIWTRTTFDGVHLIQARRINRKPWRTLGHVELVGTDAFLLHRGDGLPPCRYVRDVRV